MRPIDADALIEELKKNDLEFMQQADLMECLKDIIDRQPTIEAQEYKTRKYLVIWEHDTNEVLLIPNEGSKIWPGRTWSYVNLTKGYISQRRFESINEVINDICRLKGTDRLIRYEQIQ